MTVHELILRLQQHDPNALVVIPGYETGYNEATDTRELLLQPQVDADYYEGEYEASDDGTGKKAIAIH